jgi:hypothetical protein
MEELIVVLVTTEFGLCTRIFCNSVFVKNNNEVKTAVTNSLIYIEEDNYKSIILSDTYCWSSENPGFALVSD